MRLAKIVKATVAALEDIKARDIVVLDVRPITSLFNWMVVASADSARQARALSNNVREKLKSFGAEVRGVEGQESGEWVLVDLGEVVVHIMQPAVRKFYNLEQLWGGPRTVRRARKAARS
ncbi:MAG TPA: ribosome silencing factor [Burkholderiales bacterium]|nr:ribosome silencing factor [Burkholderiales bacterium]